MGIFTSFKEAIFGKDEDDAPAARPTGAATTAGTTTAPRPATQAIGTRTAAPGTAAPAARASVSEVDVEKRLDALDNADELNWRTSIVDLMTLIRLDPSYGNRKELAEEMGRTDYEGTAEDNIWLHKRVMQEIAKAGGRVPATLRE